MDQCLKPPFAKPPFRLSQLGGGGQKGRKSRKRGSNNLEKREMVNFRFFSDFLGPGAERPREILSRLFSDFRPKGPNDPCKWSTVSNGLHHWRAPFLPVPCAEKRLLKKGLGEARDRNGRPMFASSFFTCSQLCYNLFRPSNMPTFGHLS